MKRRRQTTSQSPPSQTPHPTGAPPFPPRHRSTTHRPLQVGLYHLLHARKTPRGSIQSLATGATPQHGVDPTSLGLPATFRGVAERCLQARAHHRRRVPTPDLGPLSDCKWDGIGMKRLPTWCLRSKHFLTCDARLRPSYSLLPGNAARMAFTKPFPNEIARPGGRAANSTSKLSARRAP